MKIRRTVMVASLPALLTAGLLSSARVAYADPPSNGCPAGYELLSVATLTSQGYQLPAKIDDPTSGIRSFGQPGNGDGAVCGVVLGNRLTSFGLPIYNFIDNQLPSSS